MQPGYTMPVGIYEKALPANSWAERLQLARQLGYDYLDISIDESDERLARLTWSRAERATLRQAIAETGVPILTMVLSAHRKYPLGSASPETRRRGLEILGHAIEFASDIGIQVVQVMGYDVFYEPSSAETEARFLEGLCSGARRAAEMGVMLGLENVDRPVAESISKGLQFVKAVNSPWFQLCPDMGNLAAAGYYPPDELRLGKGHLVGIHVKDAQPGIIRGITFEQGIVPLSKTFQALAEIGYWGLLGVEMWGNMDSSGDPLTAVIEARKLVDRLVAAAYHDSVSF
ncbi:MAG: L-ribulose-5-phosphate 3-epimerase [Chloroflexi bacterium]|nr:L-ribulose-5-phosphate 3-epimerase [Chloroflexota bacterium]